MVTALTLFLLCHCQNVQNPWYPMDLLLGHRTTKSITPVMMVISFLRKAGGGKQRVKGVYGSDWNSALVILLLMFCVEKIWKICALTFLISNWLVFFTTIYKKLMKM